MGHVELAMGHVWLELNKFPITLPFIVSQKFWLVYTLRTKVWDLIVETRPRKNCFIKFISFTIQNNSTNQCFFSGEILHSFELKKKSFYFPDLNQSCYFVQIVAIWHPFRKMKPPFLSTIKMVVGLHNARGPHDVAFRRRHVTSHHCALASTFMFVRFCKTMLPLPFWSTTSQCCFPFQHVLTWCHFYLFRS
jgi:hypothetical protein